MMEPMQVHVTYPEQTPLSLWRRNKRELLRLMFVAPAYLCGIVNVCVGGTAWSLAVIGGLMVAYIAVFYRPLVENTPIKKLADVGIAVCLYLFVLDGVFGGGWSGFVAPIVFFADLTVAGTWFLAGFKKQKRNFLPLFELILMGLVAILCGLVGLAKVDWPLIVVGSVSLGLLVLMVAIYPKSMRREFEKKFHL